MILHVLFHVFELLVLPSLLVAFGSQLADEPAVATDQNEARPIKFTQLKSPENNPRSEASFWSLCRTVSDYHIAHPSPNSPCNQDPGLQNHYDSEL